jgi:hypothetical protein
VGVRGDFAVLEKRPRKQDARRSCSHFPRGPMCSAPVAIAGYANSGQRPLARIEARFSRTANLSLTLGSRLTAYVDVSAAFIFSQHTSANQIRRFLRNHDDRRVSVAADEHRHHRGVGDAQSLQTAHT